MALTFDPTDPARMGSLLLAGKDHRMIAIVGFGEVGHKGLVWRSGTRR
jgi:hypothetical protein